MEHTGELRKSQSRPHSGFELLLWGIFFWFHLANHFDLSGSQSGLDVSQDPPMWARAPLSQDAFYHKGLGVKGLLTHNSLVASKESFCACVVRKSPDENEQYEVTGGAQPPCLNCPAILVLVNRLTIWVILVSVHWIESPVALPWGGPSTSCLSRKALQRGRGSICN